MKLSLVITTYNRPEALSKVLHALNHQTMPPSEVLVADDGSAQETRQMLADLTPGLTYPLAHVWHEDKGFRAAEIRNRAIHKSVGEYIVLLDGDCLPARHFIQDHRRLAKRGFFIQGKRVLVSRELSSGFEPGNLLSFARLLNYAVTGGIANAHHIIRLPFLPAHTGTSMSGIKTCNMGFFREDIFAVNGFNQDFVGWGREDSELAVRFYKYGLKRKTHSFMAICFHLWHQENDRTRLAVNDEILEKAFASNTYTCANGLERLQNTPTRP